jgi:pimeloyl-ACP methyl ester carboxylesterase
MRTLLPDPGAGWRPVLRPLRRSAAVLLGAAVLLMQVPAQAAPSLQPCRLPGIDVSALCGAITRPLDPARPDGTRIEVHYAVVPAVARRKRPDPVFFLAGGPGQSAVSLAGSVSRLLARVNNRRDLVFIDQRGTGGSAPLHCDEGDALRPLAQTVDFEQQRAELQACVERLQALPHGDLRHYATWVAVQDAEAVRQALGAPQVNLVGGSYGTRVALDYLRQFPQSVRRVVLDGVAPPDMTLPRAMGADAQAAFDAMLAACAAEAACAAAYPDLRGDWQRLLAGLPRAVTVAHPLTGRAETLRLERETLLALTRAPLYAPALAAGLPQAVHEASRGRFEPLFGLAHAMGGGTRAQRMAIGMHFSVICAEDGPALALGGLPVDEDRAADFGDGMARHYREVCGGWPRAAVPAAFYTLPATPVATLVLSGGADPVTPARHGDRVAAALGPKARHVVVPEAAHGVMSLPCMRDVLFRFIDASDTASALQVGADCAAGLPRPPAALPPPASVSAAASGGPR